MHPSPCVYPLLSVLLSLFIASSSAQSNNSNKMKTPNGIDEDFEMQRLVLPVICGKNEFVKWKPFASWSRSDGRVDGEKSADGVDSSWPSRAGRRSHLLEPKSGHSNSTPRIADGFSVNRLQFPSAVQVMAYTKRKIVLTCSGTLISDRVVLTAAHCVRGKTDCWVIPSDNFVSSPAWSPSTSSVPRLKVSYYCVPQSVTQDVAMLVLSEPVERSTKLSPACLDFNVLPNGDKAIAVGYGIIDHLGKHPETMRTILVSKSICGVETPPKWSCWHHDSRREMGAWCRGDSGGPIYNFKFGKEHLQSIIWAAKGLSCKPGSSSMNPGLAADVAPFYLSHFRYWLEGAMEGPTSRYKSECFKAPYLWPEMVSPKKSGRLRNRLVGVGDEREA